MFLHTFLSLQPKLDFTKSLCHSIYCLVFFKLLIHQLHPTMTFLKTSSPPIQFPFIYLLCNSILIHSLSMTKSALCTSPFSWLLTFMLSSHSFNIHSFWTHISSCFTTRSFKYSICAALSTLWSFSWCNHKHFCKGRDVFFYAAIFPSLGPHSYLAKGPTCSFHFYQRLYIVKFLHFSIFSQPSINGRNISVHFLVLGHYFSILTISSCVEFWDLKHRHLKMAMVGKDCCRFSHL